MKKVMVFGVFDNFHDGHREFLRHAKRAGDYLIAVVAPDHVVHELKGHLPRHQLGDRMEHLSREGIVDKVIEGDHELGSWRVLRKYKPQVIALGYDQDKHLGDEIEAAIAHFNMDIEVRTMPAHKPETHHSSLVRLRHIHR